MLVAAAETHSYKRAAFVLERVGEIEISSRQLNRIADGGGAEFRDEQQQRVELHEKKTLPVEVSHAPQLAVVEFDGGRIRTRETGHSSGTHAPAWKESKTALFMRMSSETSESDPAPEPPTTLLDRKNVGRLAKEIAGASVPQNDEEEAGDVVASAQSPGDDDTVPTVRYEPPKRLLRTVLASVDNSDTFGKLMAAESHRKGLHLATRKAFVADGMKCNWTIQKTHFADFVPIVDFIHAVTYLFKAALAIGGDEDFGWGLCADWIRTVWQGRVSQVIDELDAWLADQPPPDDEEEPDDDPRELVRKSRVYLWNNSSRMNYPSYRRQGLPLTSTLMESTIKEMNYRVKGSEKFWNNPAGANNILALKAAALSEDGRLYTTN